MSRTYKHTARTGGAVPGRSRASPAPHFVHPSSTVGAASADDEAGAFVHAGRNPKSGVAHIGVEAGTGIPLSGEGRGGREEGEEDRENE